MLGSALALFSGLVAAREASIVTFVLAALVGGVAGLFAGRTGASIGRFRRLARAKKS